MTWTFHLPGRPYPWPRSRSNGRHHFNVPAYDAYRTRLWQAAADAGMPAMVDGALFVEVVAVFARPKALKCDPDAYLWRPAKLKDDADNLGKTVLDSLAMDVAPLGPRIVDDGLVVGLVVQKVYGRVGDEPGLWVCVRRAVGAPVVNMVRRAGVTG